MVGVPARLLIAELLKFAAFAVFAVILCGC
jgi:hypothetical protein